MVGQMVKFSIIIPAYNAEMYIERCINSVLMNNYNSYEVIVVNDGSKDNTANIISRFSGIKVISQNNQGLSAARNNGIKEASGEYFILLDSDDTIDSRLLQELSKSISNDPDLVRYQIRDIYPDKTVDYQEKEFTGLSGEDAFKEICSYHYVEVACCYAYKTAFFRNNKFAFPIGKYHEDFGLVPLVIVKAGLVNSINLIGYNYYQNEGSITHQNEYEKTKKKAFDVLEMVEELNKYDGGVYYKSFIANTAILKSSFLNNQDFIVYEKKLKELKIFDNLLEDTIARKIKKAIIKTSLKMYTKTIGK